MGVWWLLGCGVVAVEVWGVSIGVVVLECTGSGGLGEALWWWWVVTLVRLRVWPVAVTGSV